MTKRLSIEVKKSRQPVPIACEFCHYKHLQCDIARPCRNCVKRNVQQYCKDKEKKIRRSKVACKKSKKERKKKGKGAKSLLHIIDVKQSVSNTFNNDINTKSGGAHQKDAENLKFVLGSSLKSKNPIEYRLNDKININENFPIKTEFISSMDDNIINSESVLSDNQTQKQLDDIHSVQQIGTAMTTIQTTNNIINPIMEQLKGPYEKQFPDDLSETITFTTESEQDSSQPSPLVSSIASEQEPSLTKIMQKSHFPVDETMTKYESQNIPLNLDNIPINLPDLISQNSQPLSFNSVQFDLADETWNEEYKLENMNAALSKHIPKGNPLTNKSEESNSSIDLGFQNVAGYYNPTSLDNRNKFSHTSEYTTPRSKVNEENGMHSSQSIEALNHLFNSMCQADELINSDKSINKQQIGLDIVCNYMTVSSTGWSANKAIPNTYGKGWEMLSENNEEYNNYLNIFSDTHNLFNDNTMSNNEVSTSQQEPYSIGNSYTKITPEISLQQIEKLKSNNKNDKINKILSPFAIRQIIKTPQDLVTHGYLLTAPNYKRAYIKLYQRICQRISDTISNNKTGSLKNNKQKVEKSDIVLEKVICQQLHELLNLLITHYGPIFLQHLACFSPQDRFLQEYMFQSILLDLESCINSYPSPPIIIWRRTGEICYVNEQITDVLREKPEELLTGSRIIFEFFDNKTIVKYFEIFQYYLTYGPLLSEYQKDINSISNEYGFSVSQDGKSVFTNIRLKVGIENYIKAGCCFSIYSDNHNIPLLIMGQFFLIPNTK
ncbi:hypothetical protein TBLA_0F03740 [Henningerozyma blattae CBS 6284]|uniref:Glucose starvation modulator protein 1 n=1 Tax=Henningerozyma blattae (strain ATCC 34711 / CBS 6284 / DSM 70876 / NBRC 10599 / NRRL Y-10934 / UCD 77-7) TaxID=1071380 RepID=I2H6A7_HENB6|nr:hypothetical protein TBLA_0F03740 [Tetrapisispora blattae CBS 6284]CCH61909.1 hypothetical protein TBLA_0F03740 [Tetrapisispora blattae CBS 6284]